MTTDGKPLLEVRDLSVSFHTASGEVRAVSDFSLSVGSGECVGIVGESGAGKSQALLAVMGLLPGSARVRGSVQFDGLDLFGCSPTERDVVRGASLAMVFQDPLSSLTPHLSIGDQIAEPLVRHAGLSWSAARSRALELLERVHVNDPTRRLAQYPHELSGGMRQRVMIAMALACGPKLIVADEPTTALDVTIQAQILALLAELKRERSMSMVLVTHDFGVVAGLADRVVVMDAGRVVESGPVDRVLRHPQSARAQSLLDAIPRFHSHLDRATRVVADDTPALLEMERLAVHFRMRGSLLRRGPLLRAVDGVDLTIRPGEAIGVVGESGSGKSTLARAILKLVRPAAGHIVWLGAPSDSGSRRVPSTLRRSMQLVFQDPLASLDPRMPVHEIVAEPLRVHRPELDADARQEAAAGMLVRVGLGPELLTRYPHELSGGQAQRVGIARAMILKPRLLVCDEAVSALDVSVQGQILRLLEDLKREYQTAILFISHNLTVVRQLCDRVLVLYLGRMMEQGATDAVYESPVHPYTRSLLDAVPVPDPGLQPARLRSPLAGEPPSPLAPPKGCVFHTRCPHVRDSCRQQVPVWEPAGPHRKVACHRWRELGAGGEGSAMPLTGASA